MSKSLYRRRSRSIYAEPLEARRMLAALVGAQVYTSSSLTTSGLVGS